MQATFLYLLAAIAVVCGGEAMPRPFSRLLEPTEPPMEGGDVVIAQNLLSRDAAVSKAFTVSGVYDSATVDAVRAFQTAHSLPTRSGDLDAASAQELLNTCSDDGIEDDGFKAADLGYKYKISLQVHTNRSVETLGSLFDGENNLLMNFHARTHGHRDDDIDYGWPDFGSQPPDDGLNMFTSNGNTVTGIIEVDLNSPEPNPQLYGPWPVNRLVKGLQGNAAWLLPTLRDGMLLHTGNWSTEQKAWDSSMDMPNSNGCIHSHPEDVERIYKELTAIGVEVNENPFSGKKYPFKPQGIAVIYKVDP